MVGGNFWARIQKSGGLGDGWDAGPSSCVSLCLLSSKNFLSFVLAQFALGIWCIISVVLVSGSYCSGRLSIAEVCGNLDFSGDVCFRWCNALYNSGYMLCVSTLVALDVFHTFSTLRQTRILKRFFSIRFEWRSVCPVDAPGCSFVLDVLS